MPRKFPIPVSFAADLSLAEAIGRVCEEEEMSLSEACRALIWVGIRQREEE